MSVAKRVVLEFLFVFFLFSFCFLCFLFFFFFFFFGKRFVRERRRKKKRMMEQNNKKLILCFGDSLTSGFLDPYGVESNPYAKELGKLLGSSYE